MLLMTRSLALRVWQGFSTFDIFGENLVLVLHMAAKILPFMLTFIVLAIGFGAAFTGLIGPDSSGGDLVMQPWTFSWWALNGEVEAAMTAIGNDGAPTPVRRAPTLAFTPTPTPTPANGEGGAPTPACLDGSSCLPACTAPKPSPGPQPRLSPDGLVRFGLSCALASLNPSPLPDHHPTRPDH